MKLVTVQNVEVVKQLRRGNTYYAELSRIEGESNLSNAYQVMMGHYGYSHAPVFGCVVGRRAEFYGANLDNSVLLELEIPDDVVRLQSYYDWSDVIYFLEFPYEWNGDDFDKFVANTLNGFGTADMKCTVQAVIPYILPEWLKEVYDLNVKFVDMHYGSGGCHVLQEGSYDVLACIDDF